MNMHTPSPVTTLDFDPVLYEAGIPAVPPPPRDLSAEIGRMNAMPDEDARLVYDDYLANTLTPREYEQFLEALEGPAPVQAPPSTAPLPPLRGPDGKPAPAPYDAASLAVSIPEAQPTYQIEALSLTSDQANAVRIQRHLPPSQDMGCRLYR